MMHRTHLIIYFGLIFMYLFLGILVFVKLGAEKYFVQHFILVIIGMISLLILNRMQASTFVRSFSIAAMVFYLIESFSSLYFVLVRNNLSAFNNMGVLSKTEGFIVFVMIGFFFYGLATKNWR